MSAKTVTSIETAKRKTYDKGQENVVAAIDSLDGVSVSVAKASAVVKRRIEELDDMVFALEAKVREMEMEHAKESQDLKTRLSLAEEKLRKVFVLSEGPHSR